MVRRIDPLEIKQELLERMPHLSTVVGPAGDSVGDLVTNWQSTPCRRVGESSLLPVAVRPGHGASAHQERGTTSNHDLKEEEEEERGRIKKGGDVPELLAMQIEETNTTADARGTGPDRAPAPVSLSSLRPSPLVAPHTARRIPWPHR